MLGIRQRNLSMNSIKNPKTEITPEVLNLLKQTSKFLSDIN